MRISKVAYSALAAVAISGLAATSASAVVINFDQNNGVIPGGTIDYDGEGGALSGSGIRFDSINMSGQDAPAGAEQELACISCSLAFTTGANVAEGGGTTPWTFASGGSIVLSGSAQDSAGNTIATGDLLTGMFTGTPAVTQFDASPQNGVPASSLFFNGSGTDGQNADLLTYFGIDPDTRFIFANTEISLGATDFAANGGFSGTASQADLINNSEIGGMPGQPVPEPEELGIFGLGLVLLLAGVYSRRSGFGARLG